MTTLCKMVTAILRTPAAGPIALMICLVSLWNCSFSSVVEDTSRTINRTSRQLTRGVRFSDTGLRQQVLISGFQTISQDPDDEIKSFFDEHLPGYLTDKCGGVVLGGSNPSVPEALFSEPPRLETGQIDAYALSIIGRQIGANAFVVGSLENIRVLEELHGILNKDKFYYARLVIRMEVFHTLTATKLLDAIYRRDLPIDEPAYGSSVTLTDWKMPPLDETLSDLLDEIGYDVCESIQDQSWNGFVTSVNGDEIVLSAGSRAGLRPGMELNVFDSTRTVEGVGGQRYFLPGSNIARIEITSVTEDRSQARQLDGQPVESGHSTRPGN